jgi:hypothetical protein
MNKLLKNYFILLSVLISQFAIAQSVITGIGSGTATFSSYPFASAQKYGWSTQIYKASDINIAGTLTAISFQVSNTPSNVVMTNQKIYVRHTTSSNYADASYPGTSDFTLVYDGSITYNGSGWKQINFTTNFNYDGVRNLEFLFENRSNATHSTVQFYGTTTMPEYRLKRDYSATTFPTTSTAPASKLTYQINTQLTFISCFFDEGTLSATNTIVQAFQPINLTLSGKDSIATLQWQRSTDNVNYTIISGETGITHTENMLSTPVYFRTIATKGGCSKFSNVVTITADTCYTKTATIGTGTDALERSPYNGYYNYSWSSIIYKASEIGGAGKLSGISFYVNNSPVNFTMDNQKIYVRHTSASNYSASAYPTTTGFTLIYDGSITYNGSGWKQIPFTTAFDYNGTSNLEFLFENRDASGASSFPTFRYTVMSSDGNRTQRDYSDASFPSTASANLARVTNVANIKLTRELTALNISATSTRILKGESTTLTAAQGVNYSWLPVTGLNVTTGSVVIASPTSNTTYTVTATTTNGCVSTATVTINVVSYKSISANSTTTVVDVNCSANTLGSISIVPTTGTAPYTYLWSTGATSSSITNLKAGTYSVTVTDHNNATFSESYTLENCVKWNPLPATLTSNTSGDLTKIAGGDEWDNARVQSQYILSATQKEWLKFTVADLSSKFLLGFSAVSADFMPTKANMMVFVNAGILTIVETDADGFYSKVLIGAVSINDQIKIELDTKGTLYYKNGTLIYTGKLLSNVRLQYTSNVYGNANVLKKIRCSSNETIVPPFYEQPNND